MKFGGASVKAPESFTKIAELILNKAKEEKEIVVVISAMAGVTNQLFSLAKQVHPSPPGREQAMLVTIGERASGALLAMALSRKGKEAVSFTGSQAGIITCEDHSEAHIVEVRPHRLLPVLQQGHVAIVAGFQGVSRRGDITTLGRGGSDTTAVALAVALKAPKVEFYKDVQGIFDADPKTNPKACLLTSLSYEEALQISLHGGKVLHHRSIRLAQKNTVQISVRSFETPDLPGTIVGEQKVNKIATYEETGYACSTTRI